MPSNAAYHDPAIGQIMTDIAGMFAPPSAQDAASYASAKDSSAAAELKKQKLGEIAQLFRDAASPGFNKDTFDRQNIAAGNYTPIQGYYAQDQNNATDLAKNAADNQQKFLSGAYGTVAQDAIRPAIPSSIAGMFGVNQDLPQVTGQRTPLSETQVKGGLLQQQLPTAPPALTDAQTIALTMGTTPVESVVGPDGLPKYAYRPDAVGQAAPLSSDQLDAWVKKNLIDTRLLTGLDLADAENSKIPVENVVGPDGKPRIVRRDMAAGMEPAYAPNATIMSDGLPKPPEGAVWKLGPDGKPVLDERGAPIAIPYQGGPLFQKEADAVIGNRNTDLLHDVMLDKIDTALDQVRTNPNLATGIGAQLSSGIGGGPANDLGQTLNTIKANISFDKLQALRQASPTGGALGNVSDNDMKLLQSTYGSLEQSQSAEQLARNLQTFKQLYYDTINGPGEYVKKQQADAAAASAGPPLPAGVMEEDVQHTMQVHGLTREQVLARLGGT